MKHWSLTWTLCEALWGHLKELDGQLDEPSEYIQILERRRAFSRWLSHTAAPQIEEEVSLTQKDNPVEAVFSYLTGNRIGEACSLAQQSGEASGFPGPVSVTCLLSPTLAGRFCICLLTS